ncbi:MAG: Hsp70 family protein [Candidatus Cloacimonetes bacterium]|nr:Hsp70 family protein [Candidatus Cloacimonadota bacterium]
MSTISSVGIDLGTTNTTVSYVLDGKVLVYKIHQLISEAQVMALPSMPSCVYLPEPSETVSKDLALPWDPSNQVVVGQMAKTKAKDRAYRCVFSAKSWLSMSGMNRRDPILPQGNLDKKISPLEVTRHILEQIRNSWNFDFQNGSLPTRFEDVNIVLTIPASFDPGARELTMEAARMAGMQSVTLLEEPQAALYAWLYENADTWRTQLKTSETILVCDIGGGTTDFSLIQTEEQSKELNLRRVLVGRHILLGGDNMDAALMALLRQKLGSAFNPLMAGNLLNQAREAKEKLFSDPSLNSVPVVLAGTGSSLFQKAVQTELSRSELNSIVVDGFFEKCASGDKPERKVLSGLRQSGLDYATDARILRHLAEFLSGQEGGFKAPEVLLLNGSMFHAQILIDTLSSGIQSMGGSAPRVLMGNDMSQAVSIGAAYYGEVLSGKGIRIRATLPFSYYIGVEKSQLAIPGIEPELGLLCIASRGMEEEEVVAVPDQEFCLVTGETVRFRLFRSPFRQDDPGVFLDLDALEFEEVSSLEKHLAASGESQIVPVSLSTEAESVGTLKIVCTELNSESKKVHQLDFDLRDNNPA